MRLGLTHRFLSELHRNTRKVRNRRASSSPRSPPEHRHPPRSHTPETANAAPSGPSIVDQTVSQLRLQGYHVILNKVATSRLNQCAVMCSLALLPSYVSRESRGLMGHFFPWFRSRLIPESRISEAVSSPLISISASLLAETAPACFVRSPSVIHNCERQV